MNTTTLPAPQRFDVAERSRRPRGWAYAGLLGGIGSFLFFLGPASMLSPSTDSYADNVDVLAELEGKAGWVWAFQTGGVGLAILLVIFALGLRRRLAGQEPTARRQSPKRVTPASAQAVSGDRADRSLPGRRVGRSAAVSRRCRARRARFSSVSIRRLAAPTRRAVGSRVTYPLSLQTPGLTGHAPVPGWR
jgi:hypothetical protein